MKNLSLVRNSYLHSKVFEDLKTCYIFNDYNCSKTSQWFLFTCDFQLLTLTIGDGSAINTEKLFDDIDVCFQYKDSYIVDCNYIFSEIIATFSNGNLLIINSDTQEAIQKNICSSISHIAWSPDCERTVVVAKNDQLLLLSTIGEDFDTISEIPLQVDREEQKKFVNVGWGRAETQFRGSEGKIISNKPETDIALENLNDVSTTICWKRNGSAFACSYFSNSENIRKVCVFSCDGILQNITKDVTGLYSHLDWWSCRNLITVIQKLPNKKVVCFLEENLLKHGDFQISDDADVLKLVWNCNGSILALHEKNGNHEYLKLWTTRNYKWYQKQCLNFTEHLTYFQWDIAVPGRLHVISNGIYRMYEWRFKVDESSDTVSLVAVIDNKSINYTPLGVVFMPPSIPFVTSIAPLEINAIIFPKISSNYSLNSRPVMLYCSNNQCLVSCYESRNCQDWYCFTFGDMNCEIDFSTPLELSAWLWLYPNKLFFNWSCVEGPYFCVACIDENSKSIVIEEMIKLYSHIIIITNYDSAIIVHTDDGSVFVYQDRFLHQMNFKLFEACPDFRMLTSHFTIALSEHRNLYINDAVKWRDIVSFYWKQPFLVLITMDNQLLITKIDHKGNLINFIDMQSRSLEANSFLVTIIEDKVVLEMERGNLEVICPRTFSIFQMEQMLDRKMHFQVLQMCRKQRINLNIIFDHDPDNFLRNIDSIVHNVQDPMYLSCFVTELEDANVAKNLFPWKYGSKGNFKNKVDVICEKLVSSIKNLNDQKMMGTLVTALVRLGKLSEAANYAIEYNQVQTLCHLADPISVYQAALLSFDLSCALKIVEYSKLDPSEYLPFIHELENTEINYRKFKICNHLEHHSEALEYLANCEEDERFDEAINYIRKHDLYKTAVKAFSIKKKMSNFSSQYCKIHSILADHYYKNKLYKEAAILYQKAGMPDKSLECHFLTGDFSSTFAAVHAMSLSSLDTTSNNFQALYHILLQKNYYDNAALLALKILQNVEKAVSSYLLAKKYSQAVIVSQKKNRDDLRKELIAEAEIIIGTLNADRDYFEKLCDRLILVRQHKVSENKDGDEEVDRLSIISSASSETGTVSSYNSRISTSSSAKRQRRTQRKLWNIKEGNPREEPSLLDTIKREMECKHKMYHVLIPDLEKGLIMCDEFEFSVQLRYQFSQYNTHIEYLSTRIWNPEDVTEEGGFRDLENRCPPQLKSQTSSELVLLI